MRVVAPCLLLEWDSHFFGFPIALVTQPVLPTEVVPAVLEWCHEQNIRCLYFLADASSAETAETAQNVGFSMVDGRVELSWSIKTGTMSSAPQNGVRAVQLADIEALKVIARGAHTDSRFFFDSRFGKERAADLFATWIAIDCGGRADKVLVVDSSDTRAVGYISCYSKAGANQISLIGVANEFRGRGLGQALVAGGLGWFRSAGAETVSVITQMRNVAAQRLYQAAGFRTASVKVWYHRWF
jgi:ribosomal protein S18 acetylase RimI-like enzyme